MNVQEGGMVVICIPTRQTFSSHSYIQQPSCLENTITWQYYGWAINHVSLMLAVCCFFCSVFLGGTFESAVNA